MAATPFNPPHRARSVVSPHARIQSTLRYEFFMSTLFRDRTTVDDEDAIRIRNG